MRASSSPEPTHPAIVCDAATKRFYYYSRRNDTLRERFIRTVLTRRLPSIDDEFVLGPVDLRIEHGEIVALLGANGSGKSTLLRVLAGIYPPTDGSVDVHGRIAAVMELGAGFHEELTGEENVALYGAIMGMTSAEIRSHRDEIFAFADIGAFVRTPVKYYSSGMRARLAFAVAFSVRPEIALLDEVLAVGDESFAERCFERLDEHRAAGGTIVVVSHDLATVSRFCGRAIWMENGRIVRDGGAAEIVEAYRRDAHGAGE